MEIRTTQESLLDEIRKNTKEAFSPGVVVHINDTTRHIGPFYAIQVIDDATIDVSECDLGYIENNGASGTQAIATDFTIPQGMTIYGEIQSIELSSGAVLANARKGTTITVD